VPLGSSDLLALGAIVTEMDVPGSASSSNKRNKRLPAHQHRFATVYQRRQGSDVPGRGYSDGLLTAKIFAAHALSKLGFIDQYISDSIANLGSSLIPAETEGAYRDAFVTGLRDGEAVIRNALS
jgi:hypothetical protein